MSPEWFTVIVQALTLLALVLGIVKLYFEMKGVHQTINSRLTEFIDLAKTSSHAAGMLAQIEKTKEEAPLPVHDDRTAEAAERVVETLERKLP